MSWGHFLEHFASKIGKFDLFKIEIKLEIQAQKLSFLSSKFKLFKLEIQLILSLKSLISSWKSLIASLKSLNFMLEKLDFELEHITNIGKLTSVASIGN